MAKLPDNVPLQELLTRHGVTAWDLLMTSDGSGSGRGIDGGGSCILIDRLRGQRQLLTIAASRATSNRMEVLPFCWALDWYEDVHGAATRQLLRRPVLVHCFTDSESTVRLARGGAHREDGALGCWSATLKWFAHRGYDLTWHHVPRESNRFHVLCDRTSRAARVAHSVIVAAPLATMLPDLPPATTLYDVHPETPAAHPPASP